VRNAFAAPGCLHAALGYYRAFHLTTPSFLRTKLAMPTMCVGGTGDPLLTEADFARTGAHCAAAFRTAMIAGGHFCHRESERAFLEAVVPFLA
jgi:surfactin synthase thioesterase subunit